MFFIYLLFVVAGIFLYKRYVPVYGIPSLTEQMMDGDIIFLDLRDYQSTFHDPIQGSINIPYPYLRRYYTEIPRKNLIILASDSIEKNLAVRFLLKREFFISGFIIVNEKEGEHEWNIISRRKIV